MTLFGGSRASSTFSTASTTAEKKDPVEIGGAPDDTIQSLRFNPQPNANLLASGSWDNLLRIWEVKTDGTSVGKAEQSLQGPVLDIDWSDDGTKLFAACADKTVRAWDLGSNQQVPVGQHDSPVNTVHYTPIGGAQMLMTTGWDKTIKFWDLRQNPTGQPALNIQLPERVYAADVNGPMAVFALADRHVKIFKLDGNPQELKDIESPLKFQSRAVSIFKNKTNNQPAGFAIGSIEGRVAIQFVDTTNPKDNFTFKCHRSPELVNGYQEIYAVNDIKFHPVHGTLVTVGGDGRYSFWDKDARTKLKTSDPHTAQITASAFSPDGTMFAYAQGYDWSKGHEYSNPSANKPKLFVYPCFQDMQPRVKR